MSDVKLFQTFEDGEIEVKNGIVTMDGGLETAMFVSLFGAEDWWANLSEADSDRRLESKTMKVLRENALTTGTLQIIEDAAISDLSWVDGELTVTVSIPQLNRVQIDINIRDLDVSFQAYAGGFEPSEDTGTIIIPDPPTPFAADPIFLNVIDITGSTTNNRILTYVVEDA